MMIALALLLTTLPSMAETAYDGEINIIVGNNSSPFQLSGIKLAAYLIATGDYGSWTAVKQLPGLMFTTKEDDQKWVRDTVALVESRIRELKSFTATTNGNGKATFSGLEHGIYYIKLLSSPDPLLTGMTPLLISTPNKKAEIRVTADAKPQIGQKRRFPPPGNNEHYENIDEYETALGLGNIQMHVGVCFE